MTDDPTRLPETVSWIDSSGLSRRQALGAGALATGFALAAGPVAASTIKTPDAGLDIDWMEIPAADGHTIRAYRAKPPQPNGDRGKWQIPTVIVVSEIFGLHEHILDVTRRFARAGYYAIAPDYFGRQGDPTKIADIQELIRTIIARAPDAQVMADTDAVMAAAGYDGAHINKTAITGFCWGGRVTWLYAAHSPQVKAGVAWYGRLVAGPQPNPLQPRAPINLVRDLKAPVLGLYGALDRGIPPADVAAMRTALKAAGNRRSQIILYPDADHGFYADYRPSFNAAAAADGWKRCIAWFKRTIG
jgi:carboxymethylenebutenolidase